MDRNLDAAFSKPSLVAWIRSVAAAGIILGCAACASFETHAPRHPAIPGYVAVPLRRDRGNQLLLDVLINGKSATLLVDTGAPHMGIEQAKVEPFGLVPVPSGVAIPASVQANGEWHRVMIVPSVRFGPVTLQNVPAVAIDLAAVTVAGRPPGSAADGILGLDVLVGLNAIIDCGKPEILFRQDHPGGLVVKEILTKNGWHSAPLSLGAGHLVAETTVGGIPARLIVDTGSGLSVLDSSFAAKQRLQLSERTFPSAGIHFKESAARALRLNRLRIAGEPVNESIALVFDLSRLLGRSGNPESVNGLLGVQTLASAGALIDCKSQRLYFRPRSIKIEYRLSTGS